MQLSPPPHTGLCPYFLGIPSRFPVPLLHALYISTFPQKLLSPYPVIFPFGISPLPFHLGCFPTLTLCCSLSPLPLRGPFFSHCSSASLSFIVLMVFPSCPLVPCHIFSDCPLPTASLSQCSYSFSPPFLAYDSQIPLSFNDFLRMPLHPGPLPPSSPSLSLMP